MAFEIDELRNRQRSPSWHLRNEVVDIENLSLEVQPRQCI